MIAAEIAKGRGDLRGKRRRCSRKRWPTRPAAPRSGWSAQAQLASLAIAQRQPDRAAKLRSRTRRGRRGCASSSAHRFQAVVSAATGRVLSRLRPMRSSNERHAPSAPSSRRLVPWPRAGRAAIGSPPRSRPGRRRCVSSPIARARCCSRTRLAPSAIIPLGRLPGPACARSIYRPRARSKRPSGGLPRHDRQLARRSAGTRQGRRGTGCISCSSLLHAIPYGASVVVVRRRRAARHKLRNAAGRRAASRHYWIEDVEVQVAPSLSLLTGRARPRPRPRELLLIGDPTPRAPEFPALGYAPAEMASIVASLSPAGTSTTHDGDRASRRLSRRGRSGSSP